MSVQADLRVLKGNKLEQEYSFRFHKLYTPVLISSEVLRSRGCGQVDVCYLENDLINIVECKNGGYLTRKQYTRLKLSGECIGNFLDKSVFIKLVFAK